MKIVKVYKKDNGGVVYGYEGSTFPTTQGTPDVGTALKVIQGQRIPFDYKQLPSYFPQGLEAAHIYTYVFDDQNNLVREFDPRLEPEFVTAYDSDWQRVTVETVWQAIDLASGVDWSEVFVEGEWHKLRKESLSQQLMSEGWSISYIRKDKSVSKGQPVITLLYKLNKEGEYEYRYSICSPSDTFCKGAGVRLAYYAPRGKEKFYLPKEYLQAGLDMGHTKRNLIVGVIVNRILTTGRLSPQTTDLLLHYYGVQS